MKTLKLIFSWTPFVLFLLLSSCENEYKKIKNDSLGHPGQVVLVIESNLWEGETGREIRDHFNQPYPGINSREYQFDITQYNHDEFNNTIKTYRNIINIEFADNEKYNTPKVKIKEDVWAKNQLYIHVLAQNLEGLNKYIKENFDNIKDVLNSKEQERIIADYRSYQHPNIEDYLHNEFQIHLNFPKGTKIIKEGEKFLWVRKEEMRHVKGSGSHQVEMGVFIFSEPYINEDMFEVEYILPWRDEIMKKHIEGEAGTFMTTEYDSSYYPKERTLRVEDQYAVEIRNLWYLDGNKKVFMGGPFISLTFYQPFTEEIVTIAGYVYAPHFKKREYMRKLESILYSVVFVEP